MLATDFEFRHRSWFILGIFTVGLACYSVDPQNGGEALARSLRSHLVFLQALDLRTCVRGVFLAGTFVVVLGTMIRAWGAAYLRADVLHDSTVRSERLVADGPYRYTRNPLYLGILIGVFGAGVLNSRLGWIAQTVLAAAFCYRLIFREEAELVRVQGENFLTYCRAVPRLGPSLKPRISASGARPHWFEAIKTQTPWWAIAIGDLTYALSLRLSIAILVALIGVPIQVLQKRAVSSRRLASAKTVR
jgi:protein-S-isoprenylcysteine O-methyltransferase Ste14